MGLGRFLWRQTGVGGLIDTVKNIIDEGSIMDGLARTAKENMFEDNPITSTLYKAGRNDGKREGYSEASDIYEKKLLDQADEFLHQKKDFQKERNEYEKLLDEYEKEIDRLSNKVNLTEAENILLRELLIRERKLRSL